MEMLFILDWRSDFLGSKYLPTCRFFIRNMKQILIVPRRLFFAAPQRIAITLSPKYYQKMQHSITRKNQEEHGPEVK
jgi:hypothetical protein